MEDIIDFVDSKDRSSIIKIVGIGGGGCNAAEYLYKQGISDVDFLVCNTDLMALNESPIQDKVQLGVSASEGNGAGNNAKNGEMAAIENLDDIIESIGESTKMIFLTAGMGGGTGTGATPVIAKATKHKGILTVAIVTRPFRFEGPKRLEQAQRGIDKLKEYVDSLIIIDNERLKLLYRDMTVVNAFGKADNVVANAARGIAELITLHGYINVDFEDVRTVMKNSGISVMGSAKVGGEERAIIAIKEALESPLLDNNEIKGAKQILLNIVSGVDDNEITMDEITDITDYLIGIAGKDAQVIWGVGTDQRLGDKISITIVATGFGVSSKEELTKEDLKTSNNNAAKKEAYVYVNIKEEHIETVMGNGIEDDKDIFIPEIINKNKITKGSITISDDESCKENNTDLGEIEIKSSIKKNIDDNPKSVLEIYRGQVVMQPNMREKEIEKIEKVPAYERHKTIIK